MLVVLARPGGRRALPLRAFLLRALLRGAAGFLECGVAGEVQQGLVRAAVGGRGRRRASRGQLGGRGGRLDGELPAALQRTGPLGLGVGVPAQQSRVLPAQPGELHALAAELGLQTGAQLARLLQVLLQLGYPLLGPPLVTGAGPRQLGDLQPRGPVPAAHQIRAGQGGGGHGGHQAAQGEGFGEEPGAGSTDDRHSRHHGGRQDSVKGWRMAVASTWHGLKFTVCTRHLGAARQSVPRRLPHGPRNVLRPSPTS
ncbi:hypothetical protein Smic_34230 [Streptomyces microflavus]|uniref:Uncharacterized protein n=1 Tax=Streptomyces microflavus TaxID=1919 RepID=A0A7J0CSX2_STRMI|nr:hypothetical protein Smic_34230 [Streptomyces microflavus]